MDIQGYRVFYLDPEEDINSLLLELGKITSEKIALVSDQHVNVFYSRVNIQLLEKYLKEWGKELVFVSTEHRLIRLILETNFQIFPDLEALEQNEPIVDINAPLVTALSTEELLPQVLTEETMDEFQVEVPMYRTRRRRGNPGRKILISLFALAILAGLFWLYNELPLVTVEVRPTINNLEKNLEIICEHGLAQVRSEEKKIPLLTNMFDVSGSIKIPTTGRKRIGFTRAEGVVTFLNHQNKAVTVPTGTILKTGTGIKYKTVKAVTVPKLSVEYYMGEVLATKAGRAEVKIIALEAGTSGNIAKERITQFEGNDYGLKLLHPEPTKGGSDREEMIVTQSDLDRAMMNLEVKLKGLINEKIQNELGTDYLVLQDLLNFQLETVQANQQVDAKAEELTVSGKMIAYGYHLLKDDLRVVTKELFLAEMPKNYTLNSDSIQITDVKAQLVEDSLLKISLQTVGQVIAQINSEDIVNQLKGQTIEYAEGILSKMKEIRYYDIFSNGKSRIPKFNFGVRVIVLEPGDVEEGSI